MPSKLVESLRRDLAALLEAGAISQATKRQFDGITASAQDNRPTDTTRRRKSVSPRPKGIR